MKPGQEVAVEITVEFEDVDSYHIAHHTKLVAYLERARLRLLLAEGIEVRPGDSNLVLYDLDMKFKKTARLLDRLTVTVGVKSRDQYRLVLWYRITRGDDLIAKATTSLACVDSRTKELAPLQIGRPTE